MPKSKKSDLTGVVMWAVIIALVAGMFWVAGFETLESGGIRRRTAFRTSFRRTESIGAASIRPSSREIACICCLMRCSL